MHSPFPDKPQTAPSIVLTGGHLRFAGKEVFHNLHLTLPAAKWSCLLGPSGVGKTSLLRQLAGLRAEDGEMEGTVAAGDGAPLPERIAYMAQQDLLLPWATVLENVLIGRKLRGEPIRPQDRDKAMAILADVDVAREADALPAALSGGMRQRVALARTLFEDRPVILMDEPFSSLDAITRRRLQDLAVRLLAGRTVLLVTHDPMEALRVGDDILLLKGSPARIQAPMSPTGSAPRQEDRDGLWPLYAELLKQLGAAA
ncbi:ABC transporter ATP-binding protein [Hwanghaeella grinnelliae]|uniref:ABC transporter ATP-binding protein n=1 Tax=Hwanghaeella grinnelliae TaxID=2500179 RepID=A0A3S2Y1H4_9PROT|nr:ABC transporter ATP-binding protein [Hwanghaeella grinnelliae]RVU35040.1 ABC transporter ATP-binding protein [Hwanghaeella grinnelliae]